MKNFNQKSNRLAYRWFVLVTALSILAGCGKKPEPAAKSKSPTTPSAKTETQKPVVDVSAFHEASLNGIVEAVRNAIESGVDVDAIDDGKRTALMLAAFNGHTSIVKLLLDNEAVVSHRDVAGRTALMFAATGANAETVKALLDAGAEVNAVDTDEKFTALMHAAAEGQTKVVEVLLLHNADPALTDADGDTALSFATQNDHAEVVKLLSK